MAEKDDAESAVGPLYLPRENTQDEYQLLTQEQHHPT
jgi:hypothetical protein